MDAPTDTAVTSGAANQPSCLVGRLAYIALIGLAIGFCVAFMRVRRDEIAAAQVAEHEFAAGVIILMDGARFGEEDYAPLARQHFEAACRAARPGQRMEERIGQWLSARGLDGEALVYLSRALAMRPSTRLALQTGQTAAAVSYTPAVTYAYETAIRLEPRNPQAYNALGYYYAVQGINLDRAAELVQQALALTRPQDVLVRSAYQDSLAWVYFRQGQQAEAAGDPARASQLYEQASVLMQEALAPAAGVPGLSASLMEHSAAIERARRALARRYGGSEDDQD